MTDTESKADQELSAIQSLFATLEPLDPDARSRVINYTIARLQIGPQNTPGFQTGSRENPLYKGANKDMDGDVAHLQEYATFAELYDVAQPKSNSEKALIAGYWLQVCLQADSFDGQSANKELKNLGYGIANITGAINILMKGMPSLALQIKKSGKSRQARKLYKVTAAGIRAAETMIHE